MDKYLQLVELQKETFGATFVMGFSTRSGKHYIQFNNKPKRFEAFESETVIIMAIDWIKGIRTKHNSEVKFTLFE